MWQPALEPIAQQPHWWLETMREVLCPLQDLPINSPYLARTYTECEQWRGEILSRLEKERPQLIMLDMGRRCGADFGFVSYAQAWLDSLTRLVQRLRSTGASVLVLGPRAGSTVDGADVSFGVPTTRWNARRRDRSR